MERRGRVSASRLDEQQVGFDLLIGPTALKPCTGVRRVFAVEELAIPPVVGTDVVPTGNAAIHEHSAAIGGAAAESPPPPTPSVGPPTGIAASRAR